VFRFRSPLSTLAVLLVTGTALLTAQAPKAHKPKPQAPKAATPAALIQPLKVTTVEGITEYRLANGLRVLLFPDPGKPTVTVNVTYLVGSRNENYGETGMAHLLEHLLFKGTPSHPDIPKELTAHGTRPNGSTSEDRTNYFESFQATDENLKWALELEADRMIHSNISKKDLWNPETQKGEMSVVRNEYEMGENYPTNVLLQRVLETAYLWHNYGKPTIGCKTDIENVDEGRLRAFYHTYYQPDNAVLLVSGKFDQDKTLKLVNETFGPITKPSRIIQPTYTTEPTQDGERQVTVRRIGDIPWIGAGYHVPAGTDPDFAAVEVLTQVLSDTPTGRLHKGLVETKKATVSFGWAMQKKEPGYLIFGLQVPKDGDLDGTRDAFLKILEDPAKLTFTPEEAERAKTQILKQVDLALNDPERVGLFISEYVALGDWRTFFLDRDRVKTVTAADLERVAKTYLKSSNRTLGLFIPTEKPDRAEIPAQKDVAEMVKDYKGQAAVSQGEAFDPSPKGIAAKAVFSKAPSGMKLVVVPKKSRGGAVSFQFRFHLGSEKSLEGKAVAGSFAANLLMCGTTKHTRAEIADLFDKAKAQVSVGGSAEEVIVQGETTKEHLAETLGLVAEVMKDPSFPVSEFEQLKQQTLTGLEQMRTEPTAIGGLAFRRLLSPYPKGHVRYARSLEERVEEAKAVKLEDVNAFYKSFYGASGGALAVVGDVDPLETQKLIQAAFGSWNSPEAYVYMPPVFQEKPAQVQTLETPDKTNAFFLAGLPVALKDTDPDFAAAALGNFMLGGGFLNSRFAVRIRQNEGLSYGVGSQLDASLMTQATTWMSYAIFAPQNLSRLEAAFREELDKALKDGFTAEEIKNAKSGWLQERLVSRSQDGELAMMLSWNLPLSRPLSFEEELEQQVASLTNDQIVAALRKYIDPAKLTIVKAGDFAKAAQKK